MDTDIMYKFTDSMYMATDILYTDTYTTRLPSSRSSYIMAIMDTDTDIMYTFTDIMYTDIMYTFTDIMHTFTDIMYTFTDIIIHIPITTTMALLTMPIPLDNKLIMKSDKLR